MVPWKLLLFCLWAVEWLCWAALAVPCLAVGLRCLWGRSSWRCATRPSGRASSCWSTAAGKADGPDREQLSELGQSSCKAAAEPPAAGDALALAGFHLCSLSVPSSAQCQQQVRERAQWVLLTVVEKLQLSSTQNLLWTALTAGVCVLGCQDRHCDKEWYLWLNI